MILMEGDLVEVRGTKTLGVVFDTQSRPGFVSVRYYAFDADHWYPYSDIITGWTSVADRMRTNAERVLSPEIYNKLNVFGLLSLPLTLPSPSVADRIGTNAERAHADDTQALPSRRNKGTTR